MAPEKQLIPDITSLSNNWTVRVTVSEDIPTMQCSTGSRLKRYILCDDEGNQVVGSVYDPDLDTLAPMIHLFGVYEISNADVKLTNEQYRIVPNPFQWIMKRHTIIEPIPDATPHLNYLIKGITPLITLPEAAKKGQITADVMGVVIDNDEVKRVKSGQNEVQHFTILDSGMFPVRLTLWDDAIALHSPCLTDAARNKSVIIARRMALRAYDTTSLSTRNSSSITVDPPIHTVEEMKAWFRTIAVEKLQILKTQTTSTFTKELVSSGRMRTYELTDLAGNIKPGEYWVRGHLRLIEEDQQLYYVACNECRRKVKAQPNDKYRCFLCKADATATIRLLVVLTAMDQTGLMEVAAIDEVAEKLLHTTAKDFASLHSAGEKYDISSIREELKSKTYLMLLRKTVRPNSELNNRMLLQALYDPTSATIETHGSSSAQPLSAGEQEIELPLSPLKRQLSAISITPAKTTKKQLLENQTLQDKEKTTDVQTAL